MAHKAQSAATTIFAMAATVTLGLFPTTSPSVALLAGTLLVMGGNTNGEGLKMRQELSGCHLSDCSNWPGGYISTDPGTHYAGYDFQIIPWSAVAPLTTQGGLDYDASQLEGVARFEDALDTYYHPGTPIVGVGISGSANLMNKELRKLQAARDAGEPAPSPLDLSFLLIGDANRPNGGLFARFPGLVTNGVTFDGPAPVTDYQVTDVSWAWDPVSDFPNYPLNVVADLNSLIGYESLHSVYLPADPTDPSTVRQDVTVGNTRYITLEPDHLPLLLPLRNLGVPEPIIDALRAPLEYVVELGYDRSISPGTPTPAQWIPPLRNPISVALGFVGAVGQGLGDLVGNETPNFTPDVPAQQQSTLMSANVVSAAKSSGPTGPTGPAAVAPPVDSKKSTPVETETLPLVRNSLKAVVGETGMTGGTQSPTSQPEPSSTGSTTSNTTSSTSTVTGTTGTTGTASTTATTGTTGTKGTTGTASTSSSSGASGTAGASNSGGSTSSS
jgi:hypothetical protein